MDIGKRIKQIRQERGETQTEFAKEVWPQMDIAQANSNGRGRIAKYETGLAMPPADIYVKILQLGGLDYFIEDKKITK